jgi:hypothetical protein
MRSNEKTVKKASPRQTPRPKSHSGGSVSLEDHILHLQRTAGNEAVAGLIAESAVLQRAPVAAAPAPAAAVGTVNLTDEVFLMGVKQEAHIRLDVLTHAYIAGARDFRDDADKMVDEYIKEKPKQISGLGAVFEALMAAGEILVPEAGLAHEIYLTAKTVVEEMKPGRELIEKANEAVAVKSVEEAKSHLKQVAIDAAEEVEHRAPRALDLGLGTVGDSVKIYLAGQAQPPQHSEAVYRTVCDAIGIKHMDPDDARMTVWRQVMPAFRKELMRVASGLHFFHELDNDFERLEFLIEQIEKGENADALLDYIGADRKYWDRYLAVYRADGKDAAMTALMNPGTHT